MNGEVSTSLDDWFVSLRLRHAIGRRLPPVASSAGGCREVQRRAGKALRLRLRRDVEVGQVQAGAQSEAEGRDVA